MNTEIVPFTEWWQKVAGEAFAYYVYQMLNADGEVLYVGYTCELRRRIRTHYKQRVWVAKEVSLVEVESEWDIREEAEAREQFLISDLRPKYNRALNPDYDSERSDGISPSSTSCPLPGYESTAESAIRLGASYRTVQRWAAAGKIEAVKVGKSYVIRRHSVPDGCRIGSVPYRTGGVYTAGIVLSDILQG